MDMLLKASRLRMPSTGLSDKQSEHSGKSWMSTQKRILKNRENTKLKKPHQQVFKPLAKANETWRLSSTHWWINLCPPQLSGGSGREKSRESPSTLTLSSLLHTKGMCASVYGCVACVWLAGVTWWPDPELDQWRSAGNVDDVTKSRYVWCGGYHERRTTRDRFLFTRGASAQAPAMHPALHSKRQ